MTIQFLKLYFKSHEEAKEHIIAFTNRNIC